MQCQRLFILLQNSPSGWKPEIGPWAHLTFYLAQKLNQVQVNRKDLARQLDWHPRTPGPVLSLSFLLYSQFWGSTRFVISAMVSLLRTISKSLTLPRTITRLYQQRASPLAAAKHPRLHAPFKPPNSNHPGINGGEDQVSYLQRITGAQLYKICCSGNLPANVDGDIARFGIEPNEFYHAYYRLRVRGDSDQQKMPF